MTASLPADVQAVFDRFITTELTTLDRRGQPITWPVTPYYSPGAPCIDVTTGLGYPKKARDAQANPLVSLLFSDPTGSGLVDPPMVLVQGSADVDDRDLTGNGERYARESVQKLPATAKLMPPAPVRRMLVWYFARIYIHVRPERVYVWPGGDITGEPSLYDAHMEEVRSGHSEEPGRFHADPGGADSAWHPRLDELGSRYETAVVSIVSPDGFPFAIRAAVRPDPDRQMIHLEGELTGVPLQPGLACLTAHVHGEEFTWQQNFQVRGDLQSRDGGWVLLPRKLVSGFEVPRSRVGLTRTFVGRTLRYRGTAKRELARRG